MNIVILHCHFERGGVTQVVENHVRWLRDSERVDRIALVSGDRASGLSDQTIEAVTRVAVTDFDYDNQSHVADSLEQRSRQIARDLEEKLAAGGITKDDSVLHWHNHSLGKNTAAPAVVRSLAQQGWRVLLQIHDFAEDNRPENYHRLISASGAATKAEIDHYLYPVASQIHYATLTQADANVLSRLGVPATQTHCLPNSVVPPLGEPGDKDASLAKVCRSMKLPSDARWCLYPVRGIRRKNVGEFLLLSRWTSPNRFAGLTLCPATPVERRSYERWKQLAAEVAPKAVFDAGQVPDVSFADNMLAADFIVSTSVAEGFGMAFLEPWLVHREVIARRLPTVTDDFQQCGVKLSMLYDSIPIPGNQAWIRDCVSECNESMQSAWSSLPRQFRPPLELGISDNADSIDFARLTPPRQIEILRKVASDPEFEATVMARSSRLARDLSQQYPDERLVHDNAKVVREQYSPEQSGNHLITIYEQLVSETQDSEVQSPIHAGKGVDLIAGVRPFFSCRTEVIDD